MTEQQREFEAWMLWQFPGCALDDIHPAALNLARSAWQAALSHAEGEAGSDPCQRDIKKAQGKIIIRDNSKETSVVWTEKRWIEENVPNTAPQVAGWRSGYPEYDGDGGVCHIPLSGHPDFMVVAFNSDGNLVDSCGDDVGYGLENVERWKPIDAPTAPQVAVPEGWRHALEEALAMMTSQSMTLEQQADAVTGIRDLLAAPTAPAGEPAEIPEIGSQWRHHNGNIYTVESITNGETERPGQYPVTVVYRGGNGKLWSRPAHDWHRSMTLESAPEQPVSDPDGLPENPRPMSTAPRDGTMVRLLVQFTENGVNDGFDSGPAWTIGANTYDDSGDDEWYIAGWNWQQDCFTAGEGEPLGWLPMLSAPAPDEREIAALREDAERYHFLISIFGADDDDLYNAIDGAMPAEVRTGKRQPTKSEMDIALDAARLRAGKEGE